MTAPVEGHLGAPAAPPRHTPKRSRTPSSGVLIAGKRPSEGFGTSLAEGRSDRGMARRALPLGFRPVAGEVLMSSHLVFNGVDDVIKQRLEAYWSKKLPRLEKLLAPYPADLREIRLTVSHHRHDPQHGSTRRGVSSNCRPGRSPPRRRTTTRRPSWTGSQTSSSRRSDGTRTRPGAIMSTNGRTATGPISARPGPD